MTMKRAIEWMQEYKAVWISEGNKTAVDICNMAIYILFALQETKVDESLANGFSIIDAKTGKYPDLQHIVLCEEWAKNLCYCDIDGFCISEDGSLILTDDCGRCAYPPYERFKIVLNAKVKP